MMTPGRPVCMRYCLDCVAAWLRGSITSVRVYIFKWIGFVGRLVVRHNLAQTCGQHARVGPTQSLCRVWTLGVARRARPCTDRFYIFSIFQKNLYYA
jgi:hypothetical protein